mgnify:FL=1
MTQKNNIIELSLPFKADFVSVARLSVSGIASRLGFNIDEIEDIKVSISEVCNKFIFSGSKITEHFTIMFKIINQGIVIDFKCRDVSLRNIFERDDGLGLSIIEALMDDVKISNENDKIISISKKLER